MQRNHSHYKDATQTSNGESKKKAGAASDVTSEAKQGVLIAPLGKRVAKSATTAAAVAQKTSAQSGPTMPPNKKRIRWFTCGQAIFVLSKQGQVRTRQCKVDLIPRAAILKTPSSFSCSLQIHHHHHRLHQRRRHRNMKPTYTCLLYFRALLHRLPFILLLSTQFFSPFTGSDLP